MSIKKNFMYNVVYQVLLMIIPLLTTPYISRVIGPDGVGIQSYTLSIANYFVLFAMLGINNHGNRSIAIARDNKERLSKVFFSIYSLQFIMTILVMIVYLIYIFFIVEEYKMFFIIQGLYVFSSLFDINWFFFGIEEFRLTVIRSSIIKIFSVLSIFIFVKDTDDLYLYSLILGASNLISQIILWKFIKNKIFFYKVKLKDIIIQIKPILVLFIPVISVSIYKLMDKILLGILSNITQVGYFENSEKIINIPMGVIIALGTVMLPKMSNLEANGKEEESKRYISLSMDFEMFMAFGAMFGLIGISEILIPIFLGNEFTECISVVSLLAITIPFLAWANVIRTQFLIPKKRDDIYINSTILGAIINITINIVLINELGAKGSAIATIFAEASVAIYQTLKVKRDLEVKKYFFRNVFYIAPGVIMYIILKWIGDLLKKSIFTVLIQIFLGGFTYITISIIYMIIIKNKFILEIYVKGKNKYLKRRS